MKKFTTLFLIAVFAIVTSFTTADTGTSFNFTTTQLVDYSNQTIENACTGETVVFSGSMLLVTTIQINGNHFNTTTVAKPQDLTFVSNGEEFDAVGVTVFRNSGSLINGEVIVAASNNMLFIGNNRTKYLLNESGRVVYNYDGTVSSFDYRRQLRCND
jgi:hypothetical protein